jgi:hypothetical protein
MAWVPAHGNEPIGRRPAGALKLVRAAGFRPELYVLETATATTASIIGGQIRLFVSDGRIAQVSTGWRSNSCCICPLGSDRFHVSVGGSDVAWVGAVGLGSLS